MQRNKFKILALVPLLPILLLALSFLSSCGKQGNINPTEAKIQYQVLNLSYDVLPVNLYVNFIKQNSSTFNYPTPSGYFNLNTIDTPFQIRSASAVNVSNLLRIDSTKLSRNTKYSLYITGSRAANTLGYLFTVDTSAVPAVGRGKIRFVNAAIPVAGASQGLDLTANDTVAFAAQKFNTVSGFLELPAGVYILRIKPTGSSQVIKEFPRTNIQDGKLYTIYSYGLAFRTDTAAFGAGIINNR